MDEDTKWFAFLVGMLVLVLGFFLTMVAMNHDSWNSCLKTLKDKGAAEIVAVCGRR